LSDALTGSLTGDFDLRFFLSYSKLFARLIHSPYLANIQIILISLILSLYYITLNKWERHGVYCTRIYFDKAKKCSALTPDIVNMIGKRLNSLSCLCIKMIIGEGGL